MIIIRKLLKNMVDTRYFYQFYLVQIFIASIFIPVARLYDPGCSKPLGLMSGKIENWQLSASSWYENDTNCQIKYGRLHGSGSQAWCPARGESHHWFLVDLGVSTDVSGIMTQGRGDELEWVTLFQIAFSEDAYSWQFSLDLYGRKMMFRGNIDSHHIRTIWLDSVVRARFVKIVVLEWERSPSMRLEIIGCQACSTVISGPGIGLGLTASSHSAWERKNSCQPDDSHIDSHKAWCSKHNNPEQWLEFQLGPPTTVTGVVTRGRGDTGRRQWVTSYMISYSNDSKLWYFYKEVNNLSPKVFGGNMDKGTERRHYFNLPFVASLVRIHPTSWHNSISMRAALLGCPTKECPRNYFRINSLAPCIENLAWNKEVWSNDKKHFWKDWKQGHVSLAVDGLLSTLLPNCALLDNYYTESPLWMVDLGKKSEVSHILIITWQGEGEGLNKSTSYRDYTLNMERVTVYVSNRARVELSELRGEEKCGSISRGNNALFSSRLQFECSSSNGGMRGRYVYVVPTPIQNRWDPIFHLVLCEVLVFKI